MARAAQTTAGARNRSSLAPARTGRDVAALDRDRIVEAAWAVVDREGLAGLSTHKVAAELKVKQPALYYHVTNKQHLLSLMVERMIRDSAQAPGEDLPWREWLRAYVREQRRNLLGHRDGGLVAASAPPTEQLRTDLFPHLLEPMVRAGMPPDEAAAGVGTLASFVLGHVIYEQNEQTRAFMEAYSVNAEQAFERSIDLILAGMMESISEDRSA